MRAILKYRRNMFFRVKTPMKICSIIILASLTMLLAFCEIVYGEGQIEYSIQVNSDSSATWIINQTVDNQTSLDTLEEFQNRVTMLVDAAKNKTGRDMTADIDSMTFTPSGSYVAVEYKFNWNNFCEVEGTRIIIGDVFQVDDLFLQLYGHGKVVMTYPSEYTIETISQPFPYERDDSLHMLTWLGTRDFNDGQPVIILREKTSFGFLEVFGQHAILVGSLAVLVVGSSGSVWLFLRYRRKRSKKLEMPKLPEVPRLLGVESDEERIVKILRSSGGRLYQSAIGDYCKFSRAKTSQLLTALESKGVVCRYKKGRDKIVTLAEQEKK